MWYIPLHVPGIVWNLHFSCIFKIINITVSPLRIGKLDKQGCVKVAEAPPLLRPSRQLPACCRYIQKQNVKWTLHITHQYLHRVTPGRERQSPQIQPDQRSLRWECRRHWPMRTLSSSAAYDCCRWNYSRHCWWNCGSVSSSRCAQCYWMCSSMMLGKTDRQWMGFEDLIPVFQALVAMPLHLWMVVWLIQSNQDADHHLSEFLGGLPVHRLESEDSWCTPVRQVGSEEASTGLQVVWAAAAVH